MSYKEKIRSDKNVPRNHEKRHPSKKTNITHIFILFTFLVFRNSMLHIFDRQAVRPTDKPKSIYSTFCEHGFNIYLNSAKVVQNLLTFIMKLIPYY